MLARSAAAGTPLISCRARARGFAVPSRTFGQPRARRTAARPARRDESRGDCGGAARRPTARERPPPPRPSARERANHPTDQTTAEHEPDVVSERVKRAVVRVSLLHAVNDVVLGERGEAYDDGDGYRGCVMTRRSGGAGRERPTLWTCARHARRAPARHRPLFGDSSSCPDARLRPSPSWSVRHNGKPTRRRVVARRGRDDRTDRGFG